MGDRTATLTFLAKDAASGPIKGINKTLDHMGASAKNAGRAIGGAAVNIAKIGAAATAAGVLALGAGLAYAAKQAAEEEKGIAQLNAVIKANTAETKTSTAAIDAAIAAGERKAFSDDDQRASLARLVTSTKDVNEAIKLNGLAMDFARLKGIPLADAANIIGKVHDGNVGILSRYGIAVAKGTTATEALAQVQAASAGQADAYGKTTAGSFESVQLAIDNVVEDIGAALLPVLSAAAAYFTDNLVPALQAVGAQFAAWVKDNQPLIDQIGAFVTSTLTGFVTFVTGTVIPAVLDIGGKFAEFAAIIVNEVIPVVVDFATRVWEGGLNKAVDAAAKVIGSVIDVLRDLAAWITGNETIMAALSTAADLIGAAFGLIADAVLTVMDWLGKLGDWITGNEPLMAGLQAVAEGIGGAFETATGWVRDFFRGLEEVGRWLEQNANVGAFIAGKHGVSIITTTSGTTIETRAAGGSVFGGRRYLVGERGPELFTPGSSGGITPNGGFGGLTLTAGAIVVNGSGDPEAVARSVLLALKRETQRQGMTL